jgi:kynureninase
VGGPIDPLAPERAEALDAADPLAFLRERFDIPDPDLIYFDGNSLGRPARATVERLSAAAAEWRTRLVEGWDDWIDLPARVGDRLGAEFLGAAPGQTVIADSTTVNLFKAATAALDHQAPRNVILTDDANFPTDRYVFESVARAHGGSVRYVESDRISGPSPEDVAAVLDDDVALVGLSHVGYRSGAVANVEKITADARRAGVLVLWDLCHSVGAVPVDLDAWGVDLAVGCTYKYLNAGPGAPAFAYVRARLHAALRQPVWGWFGQQAQFEMGPVYEPVEGIGQFLSGTPNVPAVLAIESAVEVLAEAGIQRLRAKGMALTGYAAELFDAWLEPLGFELDSPADAAARGSHISFRHPEARAIARGVRELARVVPDFRAPDVIRVGLAPAYTTFAEVREGLDRLRRLVAGGAHRSLEERDQRVT